MPAQNNVPHHQKDAVYRAQQAEITRKQLEADRKRQQVVSAETAKAMRDAQEVRERREAAERAARLVNRNNKGGR